MHAMLLQSVTLLCPYAVVGMVTCFPAQHPPAFHVARIRRSDSLESVALFNGVPPIDLEEDAVGDGDGDGAARSLAQDLHGPAPEKPRDPNTAIISGHLHKRCVLEA